MLKGDDKTCQETLKGLSLIMSEKLFQGAGMQNESIWDTETAKSYDTPGAGMFSPAILEPTVDRIHPGKGTLFAESIA
jgi:hypothetical protein